MTGQGHIRFANAGTDIRVVMQSQPEMFNGIDDINRLSARSRNTQTKSTIKCVPRQLNYEHPPIPSKSLPSPFPTARDLAFDKITHNHARDPDHIPPDRK